MYQDTWYDRKLFFLQSLSPLVGGESIPHPTSLSLWTSLHCRTNLNSMAPQPSVTTTYNLPLFSSKQNSWSYVDYWYENNNRRGSAAFKWPLRVEMTVLSFVRPISRSSTSLQHIIIIIIIITCQVSYCSSRYLFKYLLIYTVSQKCPEFYWL